MSEVEYSIVGLLQCAIGDNLCMFCDTSRCWNKNLLDLQSVGFVVAKHSIDYKNRTDVKVNVRSENSLFSYYNFNDIFHIDKTEKSGKIQF